MAKKPSSNTTASVSPITATKAAPMDEPKCGNCQFFHEKTGKDMGVCGVDLPPHVQTSSDPKRHLIHRNYRCILHRSKLETLV